MSQLIKGYYRDVVADGQGQALLNSRWRSNLVVDSCSLLLSMLVKGESVARGGLFLAFGRGEEGWDSKRPVPLLTDVALVREVFRKAITEEGIVYLDGRGRPAKKPTGTLEATVEIAHEDLSSSGPLTIREFGLFGGNATERANSGIMINHVTHPRIDLSPGMKLVRRLRLNFRGGAVSREELTGLGSDLPVINIDGVGEEYAAALKGDGINTMGDMALADPLVPESAVPTVKLREFRAKARMVMGMKAALAPFAALGGRSISDILASAPEDISRAVASPDVSAREAEIFQDELSVLQVALDDERLKDMTLGEIMNL
ncbi:MAG: hypothetical protein OEV42_07835 [Deltaproteobacteria bacterium]|nr:hypothetical protein [Deltaproteobacteria bacterium]